MIPRRSILYMPGSNARALEKAKQLPADVLVFDLEDAVAPAAKALAREQVRAAICTGGYGYRQIVVRINGEDTPEYQDDLEYFADNQFSAVLVPKVESAESVAKIVADMNRLAYSQDCRLWVMAETPQSILNIEEISFSDSRLEALIMGTSDLAKDMRVPHSADRIGFIYALSRCVTAARAAGLDVFDGVHLDLSDELGFKTVCDQGRDLGFDGKTLIHPQQIDYANKAFSAGEQELAEAEKIVQAWQEAEKNGLGVVLVNEKLVEHLHVVEAQRKLAIAKLLRSRT